MNSVYKTIVATGAAMLLGNTAQAKEITREQAEELMQTCQQEREANIAPMREEAIENCVNNQRRDREFCERHNRNFGKRRAGGTMPGMFWHLPVCEKAVAAERYFRMNPRRNTFELPEQ